MSDSDFVDEGDELVVRISGFPVGKAKIIENKGAYVVVWFKDKLGHDAWFDLPLNFKDYDQVDGVAHEPKWANEQERLRLEQEYLDGLGE